MSRRLLIFQLGGIIFLLSIVIIIGARSTRSLRSAREGPFKFDVGKLVIDTDAGSDDAVGILVALGHERLHGGQTSVVAITCVQGNTAVDNVVVNVLKVLDTANRLDIPVYRGAQEAILLTPEADNFFGQDGFGDFDYPNPPSPDVYLQKEHAVNALIDIVTKSPGEVTILCIGPLTNIALAIRLDPLFLTKVRQVVVLGGSVEGLGNMLPGIEFNFFADPEATFIVFNSTDTNVTNINPIILFPWESVAARNLIPMDWRVNVLGALGSKQMALLNQAEVPILSGPDWLAGDALVTATVVNGSIVTTTREEYLVPKVGPPGTGGAVFVDYQNSLNRLKNVVIVKGVDVEGYKSMLLEDLA